MLDGLRQARKPGQSVYSMVVVAAGEVMSMSEGVGEGAGSGSGASLLREIFEGWACCLTTNARIAAPLYREGGKEDLGCRCANGVAVRVLRLRCMMHSVTGRKNHGDRASSSPMIVAAQAPFRIASALLV